MREKWIKKIGDFWSRKTKTDAESGNLRLRWWQSPFIIKHINRRISGEAIEGCSKGLTNRVRKLLASRLPLKKGISVGCGNGAKEMDLITEGIVECFELFEVSEERISLGQKRANQLGLGEKVSFIKGDALEIVTGSEEYDLVHWNNSLHHMLDVDRSLQWSREVLKRGGLFYMDDFVGPSRFQWSDRMLRICSLVREALPKDYLRDPRNPTAYLPTRMNRPDPEKLKADDPSEAADSERILDCVLKYFPSAEITRTGGVVYHLALADILHNIDEGEDETTLRLLMIIDDLCVELGDTHYATALAVKL